MDDTEQPVAFTIDQLHRRSGNALAREFRGPVWVTGEIRNLREHRGNLYIQLVDPGQHSDGGDLSLDVACWSKRKLVIQAALARSGITLAQGMEVRCLGSVGLSKLGRLQLELLELDLEALLGRQASERKRLVETLVTEGIFERNRKLPVPVLPLRVGLVTSDGSEGQRDFLGQLERSPYAFVVTMAHSLVQGPTAPTLLARAIASLQDTALDVIAIVRGGGGELDAFDKEPVVRAIATSAIAVWTGIGHTGDRALADDVAQRSCITPTACGQALVTTVQAAHVRVQKAAVQLQHCARRDLTLADKAVEGHRRSLARAVAAATTHACARLNGLSKSVTMATHREQERADQQLKLWHAQLSGLNPRRPLELGYTLTTTIDGVVVREATSMHNGDSLVTLFSDGRVVSTVSRTEPS